MIKITIQLKLYKPRQRAYPLTVKRLVSTDATMWLTNEIISLNKNNFQSKMLDSEEYKNELPTCLFSSIFFSLRIHWRVGLSKAKKKKKKMKNEQYIKREKKLYQTNREGITNARYHSEKTSLLVWAVIEKNLSTQCETCFSSHRNWHERK